MNRTVYSQTSAALCAALLLTLPASALAYPVYGSIGAYTDGPNGNLHSSARAPGELRLGSETFSPNETASGEGPTGISISENFALLETLVVPGGTVPPSGLEFNRTVGAWMQTNSNALHACGYPDVPDTSSATGDMYSAAGFTALNVTPGVTWSSESGVFLSEPDSDFDGAADSLDNCVLVANRTQVDADGDGLGNICDADLGQNCSINFLDLGLLKQVFFSADPVADFDSSGTVNFGDLAIMKEAFFQAPGPAAPPNLCTP